MEILNQNLAALALGLVIAGLSASENTSSAATLNDYFNFTTYGSVAGGNTIADQLGNATATVKSTGTTLDGSGLTIAAGNNAGTTGVSMAGSQLSSFTGDFSIQIWYTSPASILGNTMLFGGTTTASQDGTLAGDQAFFAGYANVNPNFIRPIVGNNSKYGAVMATPGGTGATSSTLYDYVITYSAASHTFTAYMDGTQVGSPLAVTYFNGLSALTSGFSIGGVANPAFGDNAAAVNISDFLIYSSTLSSTEVSDVHSLGAGASVNSLQGAGVTVVPEPSTFALAALGGLSLLVLRQRSARQRDF